jgi:hypothetical protein
MIYYYTLYLKQLFYFYKNKTYNLIMNKMTLYEKLRIVLIIVQIIVTLGLPFVVVYVNNHLNEKPKCEVTLEK